MMTNKQYEHLGRAAALEAQLEDMREDMDVLVREYADHLCAIAPKEEVEHFVKTRYGEQMSYPRGAGEFMNVVRYAVQLHEKQEREKANGVGGAK